MKPLSWRPRRYANIYCSPACGRGCTAHEWERAVRAGKRLAKRMGKGYTSNVWENLGWHWKAVSPCGRIKVHENVNFAVRKTAGYTAFLGSRESSGGQWCEHGRTPHEAVRNVVRVAKADLRKMGAVLEGL